MTVGFLIGKFQVISLSEEQREVIASLIAQYDEFHIIVGLSPVLTTKANPLDYASRKQMINEAFPKVLVHYLNDCNGDELWSKNLDNLASTCLGRRNPDIVLLGAKETFVDRYSGRYPTITIDRVSFKNEANLLKKLATKSDKNLDFREGCTYAALSQYDNPITTVDMIVIDEAYGRILLGRKENETKYRLFGGFSESFTESYEEDALRELAEEAGLTYKDVDTPRYITSARIDDWRYRDEPRKIKTMLFLVKYLRGTPTPGDDIAELRWFPLKNVLDNPEEFIMVEHIKLINFYKALGRGI